jgi:tetratricopeptide (TPR) repeat protein
MKVFIIHIYKLCVAFTVFASLSSCSTFFSKPEIPDIPARTVYSDMYPENLSRSDYYKNLGDSLYHDERYQEAIELYRLALLHNPNNFKVRLLLAKSYSITNQNYLALVEVDMYVAQVKQVHLLKDHEIKFVSDLYEKSGSYSKLIEVNEVYYIETRSKFSLWKIFEAQLKMNNTTSALATLDKLEEDYEDKYRVYLARAAVYQQIGNYTQTIENLEIADKHKPLDKFVSEKLIEVHYENQMWQGVFDVAYKYSQYHPYNLDISEKFSTAAIRIEQYDTAIAELQKQKKLVPDSIGIEYKIAHVLFLMKDYDKAEEAYADLYKVTQSDQSVFFLAQIRLIQNKYDEASKALEDLSSFSEYYGMAQVQLARLEWKNNQRDVAMNRMRMAHQARPDSLDVYREYAQYMIWSGQIVQAVALLEKADHYYPNDDQIKLLSAYNHFHLGNQYKFNKDIKKALRLNPNNAEIYAVLAELWYEKKMPYKEIEYLSKKAIALKSENKNVQPLLAWALMRQDRLTEAVALFEKFYDENPNEVFYAKSLAEIYQRNSLSIKTDEYDQRVIVMQSESLIKGELDYFKVQTQVQSTDTQKMKARLPASVEN